MRLVPCSKKGVLGGHRTCPLDSILCILPFPARLLFHLGVVEVELWIKAIRSIGALAEDQPGVSFGSYKVDMAPKNAMSTREKAEKGDNIITGGRAMSGARQKRTAKDWSSGGPAGRRSVTGLGKLSSKTGGGMSKYVPGLVRLKEMPQPAIINFFTSGGQENGSAGPSTPSKDTLMSAVENLELTKLTAELPQAEVMCLGGVLEAAKLHPGAESQPAETRSSVDLTGATTSAVSLLEVQPQKQIYKEGIQDIADKLSESHINGISTRNSTEPILDGGQIAEGQAEEIGKTEWNEKNTDWSKEGGDTFYSLTKDSEAISSGCNQSEDEESLSSEIETSLSSAVGPTVKHQQRQRRCTKEISGSVASGRGAATLKWDYSGIRLLSQEKGPETLLFANGVRGENRDDDSTGNIGSTDKTMLQLIYGMINERQIETRTESRRARMATKQLQVTVLKVAKTCGDIEQKLNIMESRC
ncbi:hypothetical protein NDU88_010394 [Pleurodeles waltl]|uniref:Uncharacterized protein n=1 Tax=Pleurodeles waltl TaxID=8319 RepID=A0AAV7QXC9_PLEWA|nr:hypothetical protein NDU88_010394 [Pleurodeles waltl]